MRGGSIGDNKKSFAPGNPSILLHAESATTLRTLGISTNVGLAHRHIDYKAWQGWRSCGKPHYRHYHCSPHPMNPRPKRLPVDG